MSPGSAERKNQSPEGAAEGPSWRIAVILCAVVCAILTACKQTPPGEFEEKPDEPRPREAQSDFLDIGKQAGIEWLSFVPNDQREYPELFEGLDRDQKRHLRLAPLETPDERVLIEFKLPQGGKLWPVDWYGTELMAIDLPDFKGLSITLARDSTTSLADAVAQLGLKRTALGFKDSKENGMPSNPHKAADRDTWTCWLTQTGSAPSARILACYGGTSIHAQGATYRVYAEAIVGNADTDRLPDGFRSGMETILAGISIRRDLALEGFPKHKCSSSVEDLQAGKLVFPGGTLSLPLKTGQVARKTGGDSTIQVDGEGAKPWLILRRLKESGAEGDIRARVRLDTTFARRVEKPSGRFSAGQKLENGAMVWDYADSGAEQQLVGVIAAGTELLAFEVVSNGLTDGEARRKAREAARELIGNAGADPAQGEPLKVLEGWNVGTMGREK